MHTFPPPPAPATHTDENAAYAGFWRRVAAYLLDSIIISVPSTMILGGITAATVNTETTTVSNSGLLLMMLLWFVLPAIIWLLYYGLMESSAGQATLGKKALGLWVCDVHGNRLTFWRAVGRAAGMIISAMILYIGFLMCIWTRRRQCLHDTMADCLVLRRS